jgi:hypothetical protein
MMNVPQPAVEVSAHPAVQPVAFRSGPCYTLTMGEAAENHKGMEILGKQVDV